MVQTVAEKLLSSYAKPTGDSAKPWKVFDSSQGCTPVKNSLICLRNDKKPPTKEKEKQKKEALAWTAPPPPKKSGFGKMFDDFQKITQTAPPKEQKPPPPFDIRDIPGAMRKMGWPIGAKLSQRWLDGRAYVGVRNGIFPADMVDTTSITLNWLLGYKDVKAQYDALLQKNMQSPKAKEEIKKKIANFLKEHPTFYDVLDTRSYCHDDIQQIHKQFQFQRQKVSTWDGMHQFGMTDVTAALGVFNFYTAIASAIIKNPSYYKHLGSSKKQLCNQATVTVTHIYVYAKDEYSFTDDQKSSQYLGHWNKAGVITVGTAAVASALIEGEWTPDFGEVGNSDVRYVLDTGQLKLVEKEVFYPVRNRDYREYRTKHDRGGDFVIYSDLRLIKLTKPYTFILEELCR